MRRSRYTISVPISNSQVFWEMGLWECGRPRLTPEAREWLVTYDYKYQRHGDHCVFAFRSEPVALMFVLRWLHCS